MTDESIVRKNMMVSADYSPYCGNDTCTLTPRTLWSRLYKQFLCPICGWKSSFPQDFINTYIKKWNK